MHGAIAILDTRRANLELERTPIGIDECVALATFDLLARIVSPQPTCFGGLDALAEEAKVPLPKAIESLRRLSITAAEGLVSRPTRSRSCRTRRWLIRSHVLSSRNRANQR